MSAVTEAFRSNITMETHFVVNIYMFGEFSHATDVSPL